VAIEHLARQAGINYQLDPKIGYGQPDQSGQLKNEPQLSIRWENLTAQNALQALLDNYSLQLMADKQTGIYRITAKDPLAPPPLVTRVLQLQYASMSNMTAAVQSVLSDKRSRVLADARTSQLLVVATDGEQTAVDTLVTVTLTPTSTAPLGSVTVPEIDPVMLASANCAIKRMAAVAIRLKNGFLCRITRNPPAFEKCWTTPGSGPTRPDSHPYDASASF